MVNHQILLSKLRLYNFSENSVGWFESYLKDRFQYVIVESRLSDPMSVGDAGVPQGSLLGPLCFIIFYNDFPSIRETGSSVIYADDDTDTVRAPNVPTLLDKIQHEANLSTGWVKDNKLVCSGQKTKLLMISTKELRRSRVDANSVLLVNVAGHRVHESKSEKLLGMVINNTLTWYNHLYGDDNNQGLISKLSQRAGIVRKLSYMMPPHLLKSIANGIFFSLLSYGIQLYGSVSGIDDYLEGSGRFQAMAREDSHRIQVVMNTVLRALTKSDRETPVKVLLEKSGYLSFHQMCAFYTICLVKKILIAKEPKFLFEKIHQSLQSRSQRSRRYAHAGCLNKNLSISRESFLYQGPVLYSKLPETLTSIEVMAAFKRSVKPWVQENISTHM